MRCPNLQHWPSSLAGPEEFACRIDRPEFESEDGCEGCEYMAAYDDAMEAKWEAREGR